MSIVVTQRPIVDIGDNESAFNAVGNPIVYKMQRKDFTFNQVNNNGGFVQLQFNGSDLTASFTVGDSVYVKSDNSVYDLFGKVTARSFSTNTLVTIDQAYINTAPGGFVNNDTLKSSYRLSVSVYNGSDVLLNDSAFIYSPSRKGELIINVASIVRAYLNPDIDIDLTLTGVVADNNAFIEFYIKYTELWLGGSSSEVSDTANRIYGVLGARQIPAQYGGNMLPYVVFEDGDPLAKWLTKLTSPKAWVGYPFVLSAIITEAIDTIDITLLNYADPSVISESSVFEILTNNFEESGLAVMYNGDGQEVIEELTVQVVQPCANPIMLMCRNTLGGVLQWLFDYNQEYTFDYGGGRKAKRLILSTNNLTINEWEALQDFIQLGEVYRNNIVELTSDTIKTSSRIGHQVYQVLPDGSKIGVLVISNKNDTTTRQIKHTFEIEIEYPEEFVP